MRELSLNVLDVAQNSIRANAKLITIAVIREIAANSLTIRIVDDGCGMNEAQRSAVEDPFFTTRTTRDIGMGVPLFKMAAEMTGGSFRLDSQEGQGTTVEARFHTGHVDCMPLGDVNSSIHILVTMNPALDFIYRYAVDEQEFVLDTRELRDMLGDVPLDTPDVSEWIREYLQEQTALVDNNGNHEIPQEPNEAPLE